MSRKITKNQSVKSQGQQRKSIRRGVILLTAVVIFMFAFSYMMVPIFTYVCKQLGINGKGVMSPTVASSSMKIDSSRIIKIEFASTINSNVKFKFIPLQNDIRIHPGERKIIYFYAENLSGMDKTMQAVPSITPADAARFFKKIECFCFTQQFFNKGEKADMFVNFYIDPAVPKDIKEITLSYTLYDASAYPGKASASTKGRIRL